MLRPQSIVLFEKLYLTLIAVGLLNAVLRWSTIQSTVANQPDSAMLPSWFLPATVAVGLLLNILFWYFIARRGSNIARWLYTIGLAVGVFGIILSAVTGALFLDPIGAVVALVNTSLSLACGWLIFRPDTASWFKGHREGDLNETFS